jgi:putative salt-induced outer membrane protein
MKNQVTIQNTKAFAKWLALATCVTVPQLKAQTPVTNNAVPKWDVSVGAGLTATAGNSDTVMATINGRADKKWDVHELHFGIDGTYGEDNGETSNERLGGFAQYNYLFTERLYGYLRLDALHDAIADVEYRFVLSPGVGYYIIKEPKTTFAVEGGPGMVVEKQGRDEHTYFILRIAEKFEHKFNDHVRIWESVEFLPQIDNWDNFIINAEAGVESALSKAWALRLVLQDTYDNQPAPGRKENDFKVIAGIQWKLIH